jgi:hypothetical protein
MTTYTVEKYNVLNGRTTIETREGLTWDEATKAALELGAKPGTGEANTIAFLTSDLFTYVSVDAE